MSRTRPSPDTLWARLAAARHQSEALCASLEIEDYGVQALASGNPPKWHLAHMAWFLENFLLIPYDREYRVFDRLYHRVFNSGFKTFGQPFDHSKLGTLSRPTVAQVLQYRAHVGEGLARLRSEAERPENTRLIEIAEWGVQHEYQHQEMMLLDIQYNFAQNPWRPAYRSDLPPLAATGGHPAPMQWLEFPGGDTLLGAPDPAPGLDKERPAHPVRLAPYALADRSVTVGEYLDFIEDGGYQRAALWSEEGWKTRTEKNWEAPLYWEKRGTNWEQYTFSGMRTVCCAAPVSHVSFYEAQAYARWAGARLPSEAEWENAVREEIGSEEDEAVKRANLLDSGWFQPVPAAVHEGYVSPRGLRQTFGDVWEWTTSDYLPYPDSRTPGGALAEYTGTFMPGEKVLRGGSCLTPAPAARATYRNFFRAWRREIFAGIRLARDIV